MISCTLFKKMQNYAFAGLIPVMALTCVPAQAQIDSNEAPQRLIAITHSSTEVRLSWLALEDSDVMGYSIYRDGEQIAQTSETFFIDAEAQANTRHSYYVQAFDQDNNTSAISNADSVKTLINDDNDGLRNGSAANGGRASLRDLCGTRNIDNISDTELDSCLDNVIEQHDLKQNLGDMQAFVARLRRQEEPAMVNLGMRLFHSKSLSQNDDVSCSSCHHPALSCGGDNLSMPIGVNALVPDLLGLGRSDGNNTPLVGRHSPHICNTALWTNSMFWDQRVGLRGNRGAPGQPGLNQGQVSTADIRTPERTVSQIINSEVNNTDPLRLLMAQAHFPVTAAEEMGDSSDFATNQEYREHIASKLQSQWADDFNSAFGSEEVNFTRIARALAAYEASFLFIDNPFFNYVDGDRDSLSSDEKRGAVLFYTRAGCAGCHSGTFFSQERVRGPVYPQIGIKGAGDGNDRTHFRIPSLLNVGITAPYGDKGVFQTLERVLEHYSDVNQSLTDFYANNEACALPQFQHLSTDECRELVADGEAHILNLLSEQNNATAPAPGPRGDGGLRGPRPDRGQPPIDQINAPVEQIGAAVDQIGVPGIPPQNIRRSFSEQEVTYLAAFLRSLTDEEAKAGSNEINALIPARDGGPDGNQLDALNQDGDPL